jgi:uncharacterized protein DUF4114
MFKIWGWYKSSFASCIDMQNIQNGIKTLVAACSLLLTLGMKASPIYVNPLGENSSDASLSLQGIIDARGNTLVNVDNDQMEAGVASAWTSTGSFSVTAVVDAVAGSATINSFGIYDIADPSQKIQIFLGGQGGDTASFSSPWAQFGFYLINPNYGSTWYSDPSLNAGQTHVVTYQGQGETLNLGSDSSNPAGSVVWDSNSYLMGWEDTDLSTADLDYNDIIVVVSNVQPATVPDDSSTVGLLGMAIMGLVFLQKASVIHQKQPMKAPAKFKRGF